MERIPPLEDLGRRIVIFGASNSGKSTLAAAIAARIGVPPVHLDQLYHQPRTNWVPRPREEFHVLQRDAMRGDAWVMDGNYSALVEERLSRATGAIVLDDGHWQRTGRYIVRTLLQRRRVGNLEGNKDSLKWSMFHWVFVASRHHGERYRAIVDTTTLPRVYCQSLREVKALYTAWGLQRP
ncbi:AAA family ATPase [Devosia sp. PTR5]|uniref:AAA family ATPase n=1 Tax=Devosia oryzisoli TaxID=2774138 RepID=A0A927FUT3_9HYPH|nr:AAA family ATPase [Devosia oryzisoli]MBD8064476.1 AAA family ATPase [Devosia oryzisoli]